VNAYESAVAKSKANYDASSDSEKYYRNEKYRHFKEKIWEVGHPDQPMPALDGDEDNDIIMALQKVSYKCPITTMWLEVPVTSQTCKHSFSQDAILDFIRQKHGRTKCPIPGCDKVITANDFKIDKALARKVEQAKALDEDDDQEMYVEM